LDLSTGIVDIAAAILIQPHDFAATADDGCNRQPGALTTPLLACEVANALRYKPGYDKDKLAEVMNYLFKLHLHEIPIDLQLLSGSAEIAFRGGVTICDAIPVALATLKKVKCITGDEHTQYLKLKTKGYPIELL